MEQSYTRACRYVETFIPTEKNKHPGKVGLERMKKLLDLLGNPQTYFSSIHVAGTSGKGSTVTLLSELLQSQGKIGRLTSPHLEKINERITVNGKNVSDQEFVRLAREIEPAVRELSAQSIGPPSYFEILTAMAFLFFMKKKVDRAVVEVGMGGTYDATNVLMPQLSVITNIGWDHTDVLGTTVEEIAREKAGIIKPRVPVISGAVQPTVRRVIDEACRRNETSATYLHRDVFYTVKRVTDAGCVFDYRGKNTYNNLVLPLIGRHQGENASLALCAAEKVAQSWNEKFGKQDAVQRAIKRVSMPGRCEIVRKSPYIILDGAHNADKARAVTQVMREVFPQTKCVSVIAIKEGKDAYGILTHILSVCSDILVTSFRLKTDLGMTRSFNPVALRDIAKTINPVCAVEVVPDAREAVIRSQGKIGSDGCILITGSLYLIGQVRPVCRR